MDKVKSFIPKTLKEALEIRANNDCIILAGGSDLMVSAFEYPRMLPNFAKPVLIIRNLSELKGIYKNKKGELEISSGSTSNEIASSSLCPYSLREAAGHMGAVGLRNSATIGGNINNASPKGDMPGPLYLFDARVRLQSIKGEREVPIAEYITGLKQTLIKSDEIMTHVILPLGDSDFTNLFWHKLGFRAANSISKLTLSGAIKIEGDKIADFRLSATACGAKTNRNRQVVESPFIGMNKKDFKNAIPKIQAAFDSIISPRAMPELRREAAKRLIEDFITRSLKSGSEKYMN